MIGVYDHNSGKVSRPTVVSDKIGVDDPHDNPSLLIDDDGFIWVFVSGREKKDLVLNTKVWHLIILKDLSN